MIVLFLKVKKILGAKTWQIEATSIFACLLLIWLISGGSYIEGIGVLAVFFTFMHASVANRLEEAEEKRAAKEEPLLVSCYKLLNRYYYAKEGLWLVYFILKVSVAGLAGVALFLAYPIWRNYYTKRRDKR
ncbi:MAG: hypothetical protein BWY51_00821 [Parcubacteria group bacterium ADurb.Bin316]|nr:MAG: hypothetical protein BWY51_00821 [Parcubacteria group bacterium ADurb.Bin316]